MPLNSRIPTEMFDLWPGHWTVFFFTPPKSTDGYRRTEVGNKLAPPPLPPQKNWVSQITLWSESNTELTFPAEWLSKRRQGQILEMDKLR